MIPKISLNLLREIHFEKDGKTFSGTLLIDALEQLDEGKWACFWSCDYLCENGRVYGEDALRALANCLKLIRDLIDDAIKDGWIIWWRYREDNCRL